MFRYIIQFWYEYMEPFSAHGRSELLLSHLHVTFIIISHLSVYTLCPSLISPYWTLAINAFLTPVSSRRCVLDGEEDNNVIAQPIVNQGSQILETHYRETFFWKADGKVVTTFKSSLGHWYLFPASVIRCKVFVYILFLKWVGWTFEDAREREVVS